MRIGLRLHVAAAIFAIAAPIGPAMAGMPDWATSAAEAAPPVPEGMPEWPARTLLAETSIVVSEDGATWHVTRRQVLQVLSARVEPDMFRHFSFDDSMKVKKSKGWHLPPGEHARRNYGGAVDIGLPSDFLSDQKTRVIALEDVKKGSVVATEFQAEYHPYTLTNVESFFEGVPVTVSRWSIELPPGWSLHYAWLPGGGSEPARSGATWVFERHDLEPAREQPLGESPSDLAPRLLVALQPPPGVTPPTPAFPDWDAMGRWYRQLAKDRDASTPAIEAATNDALAGAGAAPLDRIRAVSLFVRDRVRYVAREIGIGGYQPHAASEVFSALHGDCKDKGTLLRAALQGAGFSAYPILVNASNSYSVSREVPAIESFDHFVVGVVWPKGAPFPDEALPAKIDAGDAGILLVVDPTDDTAWPGTLPAYLAGKSAVVITGDHGVLLTLPAGEPKFHRIVRTATAALAADDSVTVQLVSRMYGGPAEDARHANAVSFKNRREHVESALRSAWPGTAVNDYKVVPEDVDGAYVETLSLSLPAGSLALREGRYGIFEGATAAFERVPLGKRTTAVQYPYPLEVRYDVTLTGTSSASTLPDPVKASGAAWAVETAFHREGEAIHGTWTADLRQVHFEPAAFPDLKQFWSAASKAAATGVALAH